LAARSADLKMIFGVLVVSWANDTASPAFNPYSRDLA
jgi:hypothetical protein